MLRRLGQRRYRLIQRYTLSPQNNTLFNTLVSIQQHLSAAILVVDDTTTTARQAKSRGMRQ
jgi:hypothetical protein